MPGPHHGTLPGDRVVDGDRAGRQARPTTPGVSLQSEGTPERVYLSGLYYGGKGTASVVELETAAGPVRGKLLELPGRPGWGVWYATAKPVPADDSWHFVSEVTVRNTKGKVYASMSLR
ncbi:hypothetical protein SALBM217S_10100 [Streptomyces griseoloalbus]